MTYWYPDHGDLEDFEAQRAYFAELDRKKAAGELKTFDQLRDDFNERWPDGLRIDDLYRILSADYGPPATGA